MRPTRPKRPSHQGGISRSRPRATKGWGVTNTAESGDSPPPSSSYTVNAAKPKHHKLEPHGTLTESELHVVHELVVLPRVLILVKQDVAAGTAPEPADICERKGEGGQE